LAAPQVDLPLRLFIVNLEAEKGKGEELVFINPVVTRPKSSSEMEEGCLSLPGLYGPVVRPKQVRINAYDLTGQEIVADVSGMMARVVQHELDHLDGVLFIDRMSDSARLKTLAALEEFELDFRSRRTTGSIPDDATLARQRLAWESRYCS
jgi:peptide deformylase